MINWKSGIKYTKEIAEAFTNLTHVCLRSECNYSKLTPLQSTPIRFLQQMWAAEVIFCFNLNCYLICAPWPTAAAVSEWQWQCSTWTKFSFQEKEHCVVSFVPNTVMAIHRRLIYLLLDTQAIWSVCECFSVICESNF